MQPTTGDVLRVFWSHAKKHGWMLVFISLLTILSTAMDSIQPWFLKALFDQLEAHPFQTATLDVFLPIILTIFITKCISWTAWRMMAIFTNRFQPRVMADLSQTVFEHLLGHSYRYFADNFAGSLSRQVNRVGYALERFADEIQFRLVPTIGLLLVAVIGLSIQRPLLGFLFAVWVVVLSIVNFYASRWANKRDVVRAEMDSRVGGILSDAVTNAITIKLFPSEKKEAALFREASVNFANAQIRSWDGHEVSFALQGALMIMIEIGFMVFAVNQWLAGTFTLGDIAFIQTALALVFGKVWDLGRTFRKLLDAVADGKEAVSIMMTPHEIQDRPNATELVITEGEIVFDHVSFAFNKRPVLNRFNLTIAPGEKIALVGPSGAGKSTITKLLFRFFDLPTGEIRIDGQNIAEVTQASLRNAIALVPQDPSLFHRTIYENILYGQPNAKKADVIAAAKQARCHDFISALPKGYDTYVGERGVKLSGGERQRVAIARAILKNAPILVLDEATASLDSESEQLIQEALKDLMKNKTVLVIAHRLSTIAMMDRILVIESGKIASQGTHKQLLKKRGTYQKLWNIQAGAFE